MRSIDQFNRAMVRLRESEGYRQLAVVAMGNQLAPLRLGVAAKTETQIAKLQQGNPYELHVVWSTWLAGDVIARTIVSRTIAALSRQGLMLEGQWTCCDLDQLLPILKTEIAERRAATFSDGELVRLLVDKRNREADRFARGIC